MTERRRKVYRPYRGSRGAGRAPALTIALLELRLGFRKPWVRRLLLAACVPLLFMTAVLYVDVVIEGQTRMRVLEREVYNNLYRGEVIVLMLLMAAAGASAIARDVASRAHQLYFSRPLSPLAYCLGKVLALFGLFALGFLAPGLALCVVDIALSPEPDFLGFVEKLLQVGAYGTLLSAAAACMIACLSSFGRRPRAIGMTWVGVWVFSAVVARLLARRDRDHWTNLLSLHELFRETGLVLFQPDKAEHGFTAMVVVALLGVGSFLLLWWRIAALQRKEGA